MDIKKEEKIKKINKATVIIICVYLAFCVFSSVYFLLNASFQCALTAFGYLLFVPVYFIFERVLKIEFSTVFTLLLLFLAVGAILGGCWNLYIIIPFFDLVLHGLSGVIFTCFGFTVGEKFFGKATSKRKFFGLLTFSICFSLAVALVWEVYEYFASSILNLDMQEDTVVNGIKSYLLAGSHKKPLVIDGIYKTVVYYGKGQTLEINGYLDLGGIDTLGDMIICLIGTLIYAVFKIFYLLYRYKAKE